MSRFDEDRERLPEGMTRVGYDADTGVYTFQDSDGSYWEGPAGVEYGNLTRVGEEREYTDTEPFLVSDAQGPRESTSWRRDMRPLLNFGVIIGLSLLLLFWYLHWMASDEKSSINCPGDNLPYQISNGDTCWQLSEKKGISVEELKGINVGLDCDNLKVGSQICLPA